jgi:hypothetical protein
MPAPPVIIWPASPDNPSVVGNGQITEVTRIQATGAGGAITFALNGTAEDEGLFSMNSSTGVLSFLAAPSFGSPLDSDADNFYLVDVKATDSNGSAVRNLSVPVTSPNYPNVLHRSFQRSRKRRLRKIQ